MNKAPRGLRPRDLTACVFESSVGYSDPITGLSALIGYRRIAVEKSRGVLAVDIGIPLLLWIRHCACIRLRQR